MANLWRAPDFDPTARERRGKQLDSIKFDEELLDSIKKARLSTSENVAPGRLQPEFEQDMENSRASSDQAFNAGEAARVSNTLAGAGAVRKLSFREPPPIGEEEQKLTDLAIKSLDASMHGPPPLDTTQKNSLEINRLMGEAKGALGNTRPSYTQQTTGAELRNMDPNRKFDSLDDAIKLDAFHGAASQLMGDTFASRQAAAQGAGLQYGASITAGNIGGNIGDKNAASLTQTVSGKYGSGFSTAPLVPTIKQSLGGSIASAAPKPAAPTRLQKDGEAADAAAQAAAKPTTPLAAATPTDPLGGMVTPSGELTAPAQAAAPNAAPTVATTPLRQKTALDTAFPNSALSLQLRPAAQTAAPNAAPNSMEAPEYDGMSRGAVNAATEEALGKKRVPKFITTAASEGIFELSNIDTSRSPSIKSASTELTASIKRRLARFIPADHVAGEDIPYYIAKVQMNIDPNDPAKSLQQIGYRVKRSKDPTAIREYQDLVNLLAPARA